MEETRKKLEQLIAKMNSALSAGALDRATLDKLEEVCSSDIRLRQKSSEATDFKANIIHNINTKALAQLIKGVMESAYCPKGIEMNDEGKAYDYIYDCLVSIKHTGEAIKKADALYLKYESARIVAAKKDAPEQAKETLAAIEKQVKDLCGSTKKEAVEAFKNGGHERIRFYRRTIDDYAHFDIESAVKALGKDDKPAEFLSQFDVSYNAVFTLANKTATEKGRYVNGCYKLIIHPAKGNARKLEMKMMASKEYSAAERLNEEEKFIAAVNAELAKKGILLSQQQS